jgi:hypothetical protein
MQFRPSRRSDPDKELPSSSGVKLRSITSSRFTPRLLVSKVWLTLWWLRTEPQGGSRSSLLRAKAPKPRSELYVVFWPPEKNSRKFGGTSRARYGACEAVGWPLQQSTPGRPQRNGVAERAVRACLEGTRTVIEQAGLKKSGGAELAATSRLFTTARTRMRTVPQHGPGGLMPLQRFP